MKIGVLALQGAVREHIRHIELSGHEGIPIKKVEQLDDIDGLILPGGESTTLRRLMDLYGFKEKLQQSDLPMFGTCAGLIVLASDVEGEEGYLNKLVIRAPHIAKVADNVEILSKVGDKIVAVKQGEYLGVSFHPELTDGYRVTDYFINHIIQK